MRMAGALMLRKINMDLESELTLLADADARAAKYLKSVDDRPAFPSPQSISGLNALAGALPQSPSDPKQMLALLDDIGGPGTTTSAGCRSSGTPGRRLGPVRVLSHQLADDGGN
jgi:hypothetical protein